MTLALDIINNLSGYSKAKYSTWFYYRPDRILFDVGEGVSVCMGNCLYGIESIFLSHGHGDHIGGLLGLLHSRASSMGDVKKPITIWFPKGDRNIYRIRDYIQDALGNLPFQITWQELSGGEEIPLSQKRFIIPFPSIHSDSLTLAYSIVEVRTRLKSSFAELSQDEIVKIVREKGKDFIQEVYLKKLLIYSGDTMPLPSDKVIESEVLLHDSTFILPLDRDEKVHATLEEVVRLAIEAKISCLALFHFSSRYGRQQIYEAIKTKVEELGLKIPVFYTYPPFYPVEFKRIS